MCRLHTERSIACAFVAKRRTKVDVDRRILRADYVPRGRLRVHLLQNGGRSTHSIVTEFVLSSSLHRPSAILSHHNPHSQLTTGHDWTSKT